MAWVTRTNLKGPTGTIDSASAIVLAPGMYPTVDLGGTPAKRSIQFGIPQGPVGPQGLPGVNAVDNDTAVAGYLSTPGTSATKSVFLAKLAALDWVPNYARNAFQPPPADDMPTVAFATGTVSGLASPAIFKPAIVGTGSSVSSWDGASDTNFRYAPGDFHTANGPSGDLALYGAVKPGGGAQSAKWPLLVSFVTTSSVVEILFYGRTATDTPMFRVNGKWLAETNVLRGFTANGYKVTLTFPSAKSRTIQIVGTGNLGLMAVNLPTGQTLTKPTNTIKRRVAIIGDSWVNGAGSAAGDGGANVLETFAPRLAHLLGADDVVLAGIGGTGWVAGGSASAYYTRISTVLGFNPNVIVFYGSQNDGGAAGTIQSAVESALASVSAVPEVYVIGTILPGYTANVSAVKAGAATAGRPFIDMSSYMFGTGRVDNPKGDGNNDFYLKSDGAHPTHIAHKAIAEDAFRRIYTRGQ